MNIRTLIAASITVLLAGNAIAQTPVTNPTATPKVDARQVNQEKRIEHGKATGALTDKETAKLTAGQEKVAVAKADAKADGKVTKKERAHLKRMQNKESKKIAKQKHDKQVNPAVAAAPVATPAPASK
jgi:myo-inositol-hexaphosphate 3-phosphohydrolase